MKHESEKVAFSLLDALTQNKQHSNSHALKKKVKRQASIENRLLRYLRELDR